METLITVVEDLKVPTEKVPLAQAETVAAAIVGSVLAEKVEEVKTTPSVAVTQQVKEETKIVETTAENIPVLIETLKENVPTLPETSAAAADTTTPAETEKVDTSAAPETVTGEEVVVVVTAETSVEPETQSTDTQVDAASSETPSAVKSVEVKTDSQEEAAVATQSEAPVPSPDPSAAPEPVVQQIPVDAVAESVASLTVTTTEEQPASGTTVTTTEEEPASVNTVTKSSPDTELEAPSSGAESVTAPTDLGLEAKAGDVEPLTGSDPSSLNVSVGSDSSPSDPESLEDLLEGPKESQNSGDEVSATSEHSEDDIRASESPVSSDEAPAEPMEATTETPVTTSDELSPQAPTEDISGDPNAGEGVTVDANANVKSEPSVSVVAPMVASDTQASASAEPVVEATPAGEASSPDPKPLDCIKAIRDLVVEVIEVEELVQRYPCGIPKAEDD